MTQTHKKIDFGVANFIANDGKVLVMHHRKLDKWLPLGGYMKLDEDAEQAARRRGVFY